MPAKKWNLGIIGCGMWGKTLARCFLADKRAQIIWLNSATKENVQSAAQELKINNWTTDWRIVLADPKVDAVVIATPPYLHAQQFQAALKAGKHILIEKPLAESQASLRKILLTRQKNPKPVVLEASARYTHLSPRFRFIKNLIKSGKLGKIYHLHQNHLLTTTYLEYNPKAEWAGQKKYAGGGPFIDLGVYDLAFLLGLFEDKLELRSLQSFRRNDLRDLSHLINYTDIEQHGAAWLEFSKGITFYYERGSGAHLSLNNEIRIYGTKGVLRFSHFPWDSPEIELLKAPYGKFQQRIYRIKTEEQDEPTLALTSHFLDCLEGKTKPLMTVELAAKHLNILFKILN